MPIVFALVAVAFMALMLFLVYRAERWRSGAIRALADRFGCHYLGEGLPQSLRLEGTPFSRPSKIWNVIDGETNGTRIIAFDCQIGSGKYCWRRSVIAVERKPGLPKVVPWFADIRKDSVGKWDIFYRSKKHFEFSIAGLTPVEELESFLVNASRVDQPVTSEKSPEPVG